MELAYQAIQSFLEPLLNEINQVNSIIDDYPQSSWLEPISFHDPFDNMFRIYKSIMEVMNLE